MRAIFLFGCLFYFLVGVIHISMGSLTPYFMIVFDKQPEDLGILIFFQFMGFLNGVLSSPLLIKKYNHFVTITIGLIIMILVLGAFFLTKEWSYFILMSFLLGYGAGTLETTVGSFIIGNYSNNVEGMSKLEIFFGLGALIFPILINVFISAETWFIPFYIIFFVLVVILIGWLSYLTLFFKENLKPPSHVEVANNKVIKYFINDRTKSKQLVLFVFFAFLYAGIETNFANFLPAIMINQGNENISLISVSIFWVGIVIGRTLIGKLSKKINSSKYLISSCSCLIGLLIIFPYVQHPVIQLFNIFLIAVSIAGIFPIALTLASVIIQKYIDEVTSIFIAAASLGGSLISLLISWSLEKEVVLLTFGIFTIMALILIWLSIKIKNTKALTDSPLPKKISR